MMLFQAGKNIKSDETPSSGFDNGNFAEKRIKKLVLTAIFAAISLTIFILEAQIPPFIPLPGIKLGLSNAVTLMAIPFIGKKYAAAVTFLKVTLGSVFAGTFITFIYSIFGGILSLFAMCLAYWLLGSKKLWAVSVFGAIFHNIGQLLAAFIMLRSFAVLGYIPFLLISAIIFGVLTGICAQFTYIRLKEARFLR